MGLLDRGSMDSTRRDPRAERRRSPRVPVELWVEEHSSAGIYYHRMTNLSPGGFFVEKKLPFPVGKVLTIQMEHPDEKTPIHARSRVVANHRDDQSNLLGAGFQFLELDRRTREKIAAIVARAHALKESAASRRSGDDTDQGSSESR